MFLQPFITKIITIANGDYVMLYGRFSGLGAGVPNWIVVDIVRVENGKLAEHWDVSAEAYIGARVVFALSYWLKIPVVRSLAWLVGMVCCGAVAVLAVAPTT